MKVYSAANSENKNKTNAERGTSSYTIVLQSLMESRFLKSMKKVFNLEKQIGIIKRKERFNSQGRSSESRSINYFYIKK
jgi:hypothetical protein